MIWSLGQVPELKERIANLQIACQKMQKKNICHIVKLSTLSVTPIFRFVKLTNKIRRKKSIKKIPTFLSNNIFRTSWGLKTLVNFSTQETFNRTLQTKLTDQFLSITQQTTSVLNKSLQEEASHEKKYFKYYRW